MIEWWRAAVVSHIQSLVQQYSDCIQEWEGNKKEIMPKGRWGWRNGTRYFNWEPLSRTQGIRHVGPTCGERRDDGLAKNVWLC